MTPYQHLLTRLRAENVLFSALVELTYRCNLDCFFCYNDRNLAGSPLTVDQYVAFFRDLRRMGCLHLALTGGEPLAHKDFYRLGQEARRLGFVIRIKSNGHALTRHAGTRIKEEIEPYCIDLSLHGARAETHDRQTRVPGSFQRLLKNTEGLLALGLRVKLNTTLTAWNEAEMEDMFALAERVGVPLQMNPHVSPRDDGDLDPLRIAASAAAVGKLLARGGGDRTPESNADPSVPRPEGKNCGAGSMTVAVDPLGNVFPCVQWRTRPIGNLHRESIGDIWDNAPAAEVRRINSAARAFAESEDPSGVGAGFCPALAEQMSGQAVRTYPMFKLQLELSRRK